LKRLNLLTNTSKSNFCSTAFTSCFWKERSSYLRRRKKTKRFTLKSASYDKIYAVAKAGSAKHERSAAFAEIKEEVKALFTEEELAENGDLDISLKLKKEAVRNVTLDLGTRLDGRKQLKSDLFGLKLIITFSSRICLIY
jgi:polyribonucleotide nucleotidyltransferase